MKSRSRAAKRRLIKRQYRQLGRVWISIDFIKGYRRRIFEEDSFGRIDSFRFITSTSIP